MRRRQFSAAIASGLLAGAPAARSQSYPARPIRLIVTGGPGSNSDVTARLIFPRVSRALGQPVIIDNRPGAGGAIALDAGAKSAPDGLTWVLTSSAQAAQAAYAKALPFDPVNDFSWLGMITTYPMAIGVAAASPIQTFQEFIGKAKANPGLLTFSSVGIGSSYHLLGEWLSSEAGIQLLHVPFKSGSGDLTEVLAGRVDLYFNSMAAALPQVRAGSIRVLATTGPKRTDTLPHVPTVAEFFPSLVYESWLALIAAAKTPEAIVQRINQELNKALADDDVRKQLSTWGVFPAPTSPAQSRARMEGDFEKLRAVVRSRKITQE